MTLNKVISKKLEKTVTKKKVVLIDLPINEWSALKKLAKQNNTSVKNLTYVITQAYIESVSK